MMRIEPGGGGAGVRHVGSRPVPRLPLLYGRAFLFHNYNWKPPQYSVRSTM